MIVPGKYLIETLEDSFSCYAKNLDDAVGKFCDQSKLYDANKHIERVTLLETITAVGAPEDYYGKEVSKIVVKVRPADKICSVEVVKVSSVKPPGNISPCAGCVVVLGGSSISRDSLFEMNGMEPNGGLGLPGLVGTEVFTYALSENIRAAEEVCVTTAIRYMEAARKAADRNLALAEEGIEKLRGLRFGMESITSRNRQISGNLAQNITLGGE